MNIRRAEERDIAHIHRLLIQVCNVHHRGRPDLFNGDCSKYTDEELRLLIHDESRPILVAADAEDRVLGYAFCVFQRPLESHVLTPVKSLYIDDLCVDEACRSRGVGRKLYAAVVDMARETGCYNVTLNVWSCNEEAMRFYEKLGLRPQKVGMETIL